MNERLENQGRLQELNLKAKQLKLSIKGLINTLRSETNPFLEIVEMDEAMIWEQAFELTQKIDQFKALKVKIVAMRKALGMD